jgi:glycosyltransferase involved in cell wall biosynthesis
MAWVVSAWTNQADGAVSVHPNQRLNVTVIIPTFNGGAFLEEAIRSVRRQSLLASEILVVDDASTDDSAEIAERHGCRCIRMPRNHGVDAARNMGITIARSKFVAFLDQDDRWRPNKLWDQATFMSENPTLQFTHTHLRYFLDCDEAPEWGTDDWLRHPAPGFTPSTLLARKTAFLELGLFRSDEESSDARWIARAEQRGVPFEMLNQTHVERRIHDGNLDRVPKLRPESPHSIAGFTEMVHAKSA